MVWTNNQIEPVTARLDAVQLPDPAVVVAGHYSLADYMSDVSNEGEAEAVTFELGARLVRQNLHHNRDCRLVLLVNDIGIDAARRETLKEGYDLPRNYQQILDRVGLDAVHLSIMFESTMRNKASTTLRKLFKQRPDLFEKVSADQKGLVRCVGQSACDLEATASTTAYVVEGPKGDPLVVKEGPNPKCNLIMATFFNRLTTTFQPKLIVNVFNDLYTFRISLAVHVLRLLYRNTTAIKHVFCDGEILSGDIDDLQPKKEVRLDESRIS